MDKYNDFIIQKFKINTIEESISLIINILNEEEFKIIDIIVFQNKSISYAGRVLELTNSQIRHRFYNILRKIGRTKLHNKDNY